MPDLAYVNGVFGPVQAATVSIDDRGFQFGDGVYEVIRSYGGRLFALDAHLDRLATSAKAIRLVLPMPLGQLADLIHDGVRRAAWSETKVYLQVTRGVAPRDHAFPANTPPTLVMTFRMMKPMDPAVRAKGVSAMTMEDLRWGRCDIKSLNLLGNVLARQRAVESGAFEALFVKQGLVTEGSVSNVMALHQDVLHTAPLGPSILAGVTRQQVLELARKEGLSVSEQALTLPQFRAATEVFLTGTTVEVLPVIRLDGAAVGSGAPGLVTSQLARRFQELTAG